jgi:hypothetical protein
VQVRERHWWEFWAEARNECRPRMGFLPVCEQRGRHVTRSSCRPSSHSLLRTVRRTSLQFQFAHPPRPFLNPEEIWYKISMTSPAVRASGGPTHPSRARPRTRSPHLRSRGATRSRPFAVQSSSKQTWVNSNNPIRTRMSKVSTQTQNLRAEPAIISARHPW